MTWSSAERLTRIERQGQDLPHTGFPDLAEQPNQRPEIHLWVLHCQPDDPAHDYGRARTLQPRRGGHAFQVVRGLAVAPYQRRLRMTFRAAEESAALGVNQQPLGDTVGRANRRLQTGMPVPNLDLRCRCASVSVLHNATPR